jgi:hypothetical protein
VGEESWGVGELGRGRHMGKRKGKAILRRVILASWKKIVLEVNQIKLYSV